MNRLDASLREVAAALSEAGIPWALVGGFAVSLLTEPRATQDLDLLVAPDDWDRVREALAPRGYLELSAPMDFKTICLRRLTKFLGEDLMIVDFLFADEETRSGLHEPICYDIDGTPIRIAPPATIINLKLRRNSSVDQGDIEKLRTLIEEES